MAMLQGFELWFVKCDPKRPSPQFDRENPSWEVQIRTSELSKKKEAEQLGVKMKLITYPEGHEHEGEPVLSEQGKKVYRANFSKKSKRKNQDTKEMEPAKPVEVVDGDLQPLNPNTIGHGSIGNIRIMQREYKSGGVDKIANTLMGIQVTTLILYEAKEREEFGQSEMKIIKPEPTDNEASDGEDSQDSIESASLAPSPTTPKIDAAPTPKVDMDGF